MPAFTRPTQFGRARACDIEGADQRTRPGGALISSVVLDGSRCAGEIEIDGAETLQIVVPATTKFNNGNWDKNKMRKLIFIAIVFLGFAASATCQEFRATLTGLVKDPSGAVVPAAAVKVVNTDTGATVIVKSNGKGSYTAPFLLPGPYSVSVEMDGFKTYLHTGLTLQVEAVVRENIVLQVGNAGESIVVTTATPMIDTANADTGQSLTPEELRDLPNPGNSPFGLEHDMFGVIPTGKAATNALNPTSNTGANAVSIGGGPSASAEVLLNGLPDMESSSRQVSFIPQLDSVETLHVDQFSANAALGDTIGGTVNLVTKHGTNRLHGTLSEYYNGSRPFQARPYFLPATSTKTSSHYNQFGATIGGPVVIPHFFNGHDKVFFFYAFEGYNSDTSSPSITSVPTQDERNGDFHALLAADGPTAQLYDPYYAPGVTSTGYQTIGGKQYWIRAAIPNNCLTGTTAYCKQNGYSPDTQLGLSPIAQAYLKLMPLPNYNGASTKPDGQNNYINSPANSTKYKSHAARLDWNISDKDKIFGEFHTSNYVNSSGNYFDNLAVTGSKAIYTQPGGQIDYVRTFTSSLNMEARLGYQRYNQINGPSTEGTSPTAFGFPGYIASNSVDLAVPYVTFSDGASIQSLSGQTNGYGIIGYLSGYAAINKTWGRHSIKAGTEVRVWKKSGFSPMQANGQYAFSASKTGFLAQSPNYAADEIQQPFGSSFALLELGLPSSGTYQITQRFQYDNWYTAYFLQDDWKATSNLTFSLGLRLDHETAVVESNNRMIQNWYADQPNSTTSAATSSYASQYAANVAALGSNSSYLPSPSAFKATGATAYETPDNRYPYHPAPLYVSPRFGFAYAPSREHNTFVVRGGIALVNQPFGTYTASATTGYSQSTSMVTTNSSVNGGYTPTTTWENPYPTDSTQLSYNPIALPLGSSQGTDAALGNSLFFFQSNVKVPYSEKFSLDIQKEFPGGWMAEISGIHVLSLHNSTYNNINNVPYTKYLDPTSDASSPGAQAVSNAMATKVTNPFYKQFPTFTTASGAKVPNTTALNTSSTVALSSLVLAYPEFTTVSAFYVPNSTFHFNSLSARLEKRMSKGFEFNAVLEWSRQIGATTQLNPGVLWVGETSSDYPIHVAIYSIYELPFGRGRQFMNKSNRVVDGVLGGWKVTGTYQYLSGTPLSWGNANYTGSFQDLQNNPHNTAGPAFNTAGFNKDSAHQPGSWNLRTFPIYLLRSDPTNNFDFSALKDLVIAERFIFTVRVDAFNALNHAQMSGANVSPTSSSFGLITSQANTSRSLAGGLHLRF